MSDVTQHTDQALHAFDYAIAAGGISSPWWVPLLHDVNEVAVTIAAVGGAVLVLLRIWLLLRGRPGLGE